MDCIESTLRGMHNLAIQTFRDIIVFAIRHVHVYDVWLLSLDCNTFINLSQC